MSCLVWLLDALIVLVVLFALAVKCDQKRQEWERNHPTPTAAQVGRHPPLSAKRHTARPRVA